MNSDKEQSLNTIHEEEVSLKDVIVILLRQKKLILKITAISMALMLVYLLLLAKPVYESHISGYINVKNAINEFGEFPFPSEKPEDYLLTLTSSAVLDLAMKNGAEADTRKGFSKTISVEIAKDKETKAFTIAVTADSAETAKKNAEILADAFLKTQERMLARNAVAFYQNKLGFELDVLERSKVDTEQKIASMKDELEKRGAVITVQKLAVTDPEYAGIMGKKRNISASGKDALLEEEIDPIYAQMGFRLVEQQNLLYETEISIEKHKQKLEELEYLSTQIETKEVGEQILHQNGRPFKIITTQIVLNSNAGLPEVPIAPRKAVLLALSLVFGALVGIFTVFFKTYWEKTT